MTVNARIKTEDGIVEADVIKGHAFFDPKGKRMREAERLALAAALHRHEARMEFGAIGKPFKTSERIGHIYPDVPILCQPELYRPLVQVQTHGR